MPNQFGGASSGTAFTTQLLGSMLDTFKSDHDRQEKEDFQRKQLDYEMIMSAIKDPKWIESHTPSQRQFALEKALDLMKPKGHQGIKQQLKGLFGGNEPYSPQAASILQQTEGRPRLQITPEISGGTGDSVIGNVTLPPPPTMPATFEKTYREQEIADDDLKARRILERQQAMEELRDKHRTEQRRLATDEKVRAFKEILPERQKMNAEKMLLSRAAMYGDPMDEINQERARLSLQEELAQKKKESEAKIAYSAERLKQIDNNYALAKQRIDISLQRLGQSQQRMFNSQPQVQAGYDKAKQQRGLAKAARIQAAKAYAEGDDENGAYYDGLAERDEAEAQKSINSVEEYLRQLQGGSGGVKLPSPPARSNRSGVKLTRAEILAGGGTEATVQRAREKGLLVE